MAVGGCGTGEEEVTAAGWGCFPSDENVLEMVVMVAGLCADTKNCFDRVNFTVCGFYPSFKTLEPVRTLSKTDLVIIVPG